MKHVKNFENIDAFMDAGGTEDGYLESPEYFIETYINGNYSQLRNMLNNFRSSGRMRELIDYMDETMSDSSEDLNSLKNWMLEN